jgi:hypothetical protein
MRLSGPHRVATTRILDMIDDGVLDAESVLRECLSFMSEADVADMASGNDWFDIDEEDE